VLLSKLGADDLNRTLTKRRTGLRGSRSSSATSMSWPRSPAANQHRSAKIRDLVTAAVTDQPACWVVPCGSL
jgi:hypothetical protein